MRIGLVRAVVLLLIVVGAVVGAAIGATPAQARCVAADVVVHRSHQSDLVVLTDGQCLVWTGWGGHLRDEKDVYVGNTVTGAPSGAYLDVWVPLP